MKNAVGMPAPSDFKLAVKSVSRRHEAEHTNRRTRAKSPEVSVHTHCQFIVTNGAKTAQWGRTAVSANGVGTSQHLHALLWGEKERKKTLRPYLEPYKKLTRNGLHT